MSTIAAPARSVAQARGREWVWALATAVLSLGLAVWVLRLSDADLTVPFRYAVIDDTKFYLGLVKGMIDHGWVDTNGSLGAPFHQQLYDYPQGADDLNLAVLDLLAQLLRQPGPVIDVFYLLTFPVNALVAFAVMRRLGVSAPSATACATLFTLLPYHFFRSDSHLFLSSYAALPLVAYLFVRIIDGSPLLAHAPGRPPVTRWLTARTGWTVLCAVVIGSTGLYYAVFGIVVLVLALAGAAVAGRGRATLSAGAVACLLVGVVVVANLSPTLVYQASHGSNAQLQHEASQGDRFALSPSYLVLPPLHDRVGPLRSITERYAAQTAPHGYCEQCYESVGVAGDAGLLWLAVVLAGSCLGAAFVARRPPVLRWAALGVLACLGVASTGALSSLLRVFVTSDIRAWNRMSVLIAFFALLALGLLIDELARRTAPARRAASAGAIAAAVLAFGTVDQTSAFFVPDFAADARAWHSDAGLVARVQRTLPPGAPVFQLPYVPYPEGYQPFSAPGQTLPFEPEIDFEYENLRPYLHSSSLRFSYGATKGRAADWPAQLAAQPVTTAVASAAAAGFDGLLVDPRGYPGSAGRLRGELRSLLGAAPVVSDDGTLWFYDLRGERGRLGRAIGAAPLAALARATLHPVRLSCRAGSLTLENPGSEPARLRLTAGVAGPGAGRVGVSGDGASAGTAGAVAPAARRGQISVDVVAPPGRSRIAVRAPGADAAHLIAPALIPALGTALPGISATGLRAGVVGPPCAAVAAG